MNAHPSDLIALIDSRLALLDDINASLDRRRAKRARRSRAARKGAVTKHIKRMTGLGVLPVLGREK